MKTQQADNSKAFSIIHSKYQLHSENAYECIRNNDNRTIQLSTIANLTTDFHSIISDFPIDYSYYGAEPYNDYTIKIEDTYGTALYVIVHSRPQIKKVFLLPVVVGFKNGNTCDVVALTDNGQMRGFFTDIYKNSVITISEEGKIKGFYNKSDVPKDVMLKNNIFEIKEQKTYFPDFIKKENAFDEFGVQGEMISVNTSNGVYGNLNIFTNNANENFLKVWKKAEQQSINFKATASSTSQLVVQVWLHTITQWNKRCKARKIKLVHSLTEKIEEVNSINDKRIAEAKQTIIDLNKDIIVYINNNNDEKSKRKFNGFHILQSQRCGFFRHYSNGKISYIAPTTVHYKQVCDLRYNQGKPIIYRNTEDFLREKSYLENDVCLMLKGNNINFSREKNFSFFRKKAT